MVAGRCLVCVLELIVVCDVLLRTGPARARREGSRGRGISGDTEPLSGVRAVRWSRQGDRTTGCDVDGVRRAVAH